jgi:hypothetical protein
MEPPALKNSAASQTESTLAPKTKVTLEGTQGTLLATLYARYRDSKHSNSVFGDRWAEYVVDQIDWDWGRFKFTKFFCYLISLRGRKIDNWTFEFLEKHKETGATVIRECSCSDDGRSFLGCLDHESMN